MSGNQSHNPGNNPKAHQIMPAGRPTDFKPAYGEEILSLMAEGLSLAASAADLGIHRQRVYEWMDRNPEFADTVKLAQAKRQLFLERRLLSAKEGPVVTSSIFALKNAGPEDWRDKHEIDHSGKMDINGDVDPRQVSRAILALLGEAVIEPDDTEG